MLSIAEGPAIFIVGQHIGPRETYVAVCKFYYVCFLSEFDYFSNGL